LASAEVLFSEIEREAYSFQEREREAYSIRSRKLVGIIVGMRG
jgi:hypothetical protein